MEPSVHTTAGTSAGTADEPLRWTVIIASGGHFAATVFSMSDQAPSGKQQPKGEPFLYEILAHKTYHRYVVRYVPADGTIWLK